MAFLGGPLHFLSELKAAFIRTLNLDDEHAITPENSHLFAAIGSALNYKEDVETTLGSLQQRLSTGIKLEFEVARLDPLFASQEDYDAFTSRHGNNHVETGDLKTIPETAISVLTQVPRQQRSHLSARTENFCIHSMTTITEVRLQLPSVPFRKFTACCQRVHTSYTPAPPDTGKLF